MPWLRPDYPDRLNTKGRGAIHALPCWLVLYLILMAAMAFQFGSTSAQASFGAGFSFNLQGWSAAVVYLVSFAYMILMEGYLGGTVGKLVLGIRVVDISGGKRPGRALIRNVLRIVDFLPFCYLLGILMVAFSKKKDAWRSGCRHLRDIEPQRK